MACRILPPTVFAHKWSKQLPIRIRFVGIPTRVQTIARESLEACKTPNRPSGKSDYSGYTT
eukprot:3595361-Rhodomonas_salina.1